MSRKRFFVFGLNHKTAPVEIRERFFLSLRLVSQISEKLRQEGIEEVIPLSTCNRTEIYFVWREDRSAKQLKGLFSLIFNTKEDFLEKCTYLLEDKEALKHLFRVSSGLDSMVIGEPQILGQIKDAYRAATELNSTGPMLDRIFHKAFHVAKRVRTETRIGYNPLSISAVAVELSKKIFSDIREKQILLIGSGEMAEIALKYFLKEGVRDIFITNRTFERAKRLSEEVIGVACPFEDLPTLIEKVDMILTSTGSEIPILSKKLLLEGMKKRKNRPLFIIDIAVPRDVEPDVGKLENVYLYNIDDLRVLAERHLKNRLNEAEKAEQIVRDEVERFSRWFLSHETSTLIASLVERVESMRKREIEKVTGKLKDKENDAIMLMELATRGIMKKLIHPYIVIMKECRNPEVIEIIKRLFRIEDEKGSHNRDEGQ